MHKRTAACLVAFATLFSSAIAQGAETEAAKSGMETAKMSGVGQSSGFAALKSANTNSALRGSGDVQALRSSSEGAMLPAGSSSANGLEAVAAATQSVRMASKNPQGTTMIQQGATNETDGFNALRRMRAGQQAKPSNDDARVLGAASDTQSFRR